MSPKPPTPTPNHPEQNPATRTSIVSICLPLHSSSTLPPSPTPTSAAAASLSHLRSNSNLLIKWSSWDCCNFRQVELCRPKSQFLFLVLQPVVKLSVFLRLMIIAMCAFYWPSNDFVHTWISLVGFAALPANVPVTFRVVWAPKGSLTAFLPHVLLFFLESGRDLP